MTSFQDFVVDSIGNNHLTIHPGQMKAASNYFEKVMDIIEKHKVKFTHGDLVLELVNSAWVASANVKNLSCYKYYHNVYLKPNTTIIHGRETDTRLSVIEIISSEDLPIPRIEALAPVLRNEGLYHEVVSEDPRYRWQGIYARVTVL